MVSYRILCFDGGGMKGLFTTTLLERLVVKKRSLIKHVDLLAGTSTGGIIALGLADGKTPKRMTRLYRKYGREIFDDSLWDNLVDLGNAAGADYNHKGLNKALKLEFGNKRLKSLEKRVLIPTFDLDARAKRGRPRSWTPKFCHNYPGSDSDGEHRVRDVALRTSSAPTYCPAYQGYIDGGVVANNPSMAALGQALEEGHQLGDIALLSLGSGAEPKYIPGSPDWGWGQWARPLISLMVSGVMGVADYQCERLLKDNYLRMNPYLSRGVDLDDASEETNSFVIESALEADIQPVLDWLENVGW